MTTWSESIHGINITRACCNWIYSIIPIDRIGSRFDMENVVELFPFDENDGNAVGEANITVGFAVGEANITVRFAVGEANITVGFVVGATRPIEKACLLLRLLYEIDL